MLITYQGLGIKWRAELLRYMKQHVQNLGKYEGLKQLGNLQYFGFMEQKLNSEVEGKETGGRNRLSGQRVCIFY